MKKSKENYIFYETGDSCRTEFLSTDGTFRQTEDAAVLGTAEGASPEDAFRNLLEENPWVKEYKTGQIVARKIGPAFYL